jgi:hypothetical protein
VVAERGHTLLETIIASAVIVVLVSAGWIGGRSHLREIARSFDELAASKAASSRLEELRADPSRLEVGERPFETDRPGAAGTERVIRREPGLYEVRVRVTVGDGSAELTTLLVREEPR